jgi:hypothetical protein
MPKSLHNTAEILVNSVLNKCGINSCSFIKFKKPCKNTRL